MRTNAGINFAGQMKKPPIACVQRGRRQGWLTQEGLNEVCTFISPAKGDSMHFAGSYRCEYMRKC